VPRVVARVNVEENRWLFDASWGVDAAISSVSVLVSLIEEATGSAQALRLADLAGAGLSVVEVNLTAHSRAVGKAPSDLELNDSDVVGAVIRKGKALAIGAAARLADGDSVLVITPSDDEERIRGAFI
jgi:trk system potassium uptake protein TrkA